MPPKTGRIPGKTGLTPEAAKYLAEMQTGPIVTDSVDEDYPGDEFPEFDSPIGTPLFAETGDYIETGEETSRLRSEAKEPPPPRDAKAGIPTLDEWMDFWSRIVLRVAVDWYIDWAFRGVDETILTDREIERVQMTEAERQRIAVPIAEISHKSKVMRKHGRAIVASGGVFDAIVALGTWTSRVNRIARKYKPRVVQGRVANERTRSGQQASDGAGFSGANGGRIFDGTTVINPGG